MLPKTATAPAREKLEMFILAKADFPVGEGDVLDVALGLAEVTEEVVVEDDKLLATNSFSRDLTGAATENSVRHL